MESIWSKTAEIPARPRLEGDLKVEAAVIGGGMAGVLTAWQLRQKGVEAVVLEARRLGSGQTKNTTAKITAQHGLIYAKLIETLGEEAARQYARANTRAIEEYRRVVEAEGIDCAFEDRPAYLYSTVTDDAVREEARAAASLGIDAAFTGETSLPFPVKGAVRFNRQAQFHPLRFLEGAARNLTVYEDTRVLKVAGGRIETEQGTVEARHIVFATHYPFVNFPGYYFLRQHQERSYVIALEGAAELDGMYRGTDPGALSFRNVGSCLLLGGENHRTGENSAGGRYRALREQGERLFPKSREVAHWSAQDCMTLDGVPYIGRYAAASEPDWYVATGFQKWGMTSSMVAAMVISDLITGRENPDAAVFDPGRFHLAASAQNLWEDGKQTVKGLSRQIFSPPRADLDALPPGHGGVVDCDGEKVGVYKNEDGEIFMVSTRCPHLGCQLEWNPDEKSWDCPCHGSRFDPLGRLIDNPAQENLERA